MVGWRRRRTDKQPFKVLGRSLNIPYITNDYSPPPTAKINVNADEHKVTGIIARSPKMAVAIASKAYPEGEGLPVHPKFDKRTQTWVVCFGRKKRVNK